MDAAEEQSLHRILRRASTWRAPDISRVNDRVNRRGHGCRMASHRVCKRRDFSAPARGTV